MGNKKYSKVSILMYHCVRELGWGEFPGINSVDVEDCTRLLRPASTMSHRR